MACLELTPKGKGGGTQGFGRGGGLGTRGRVNLSFGLAEMNVEGNVDRNAIKRVIDRNRSQLQRCYSHVLQNNLLYKAEFVWSGRFQVWM